MAFQKLLVIGNTFHQKLLVIDSIFHQKVLVIDNTLWKKNSFSMKNGFFCFNKFIYFCTLEIN